MQPAPLVLKGGGLTLRPLVADDRDALFAAASDPLIWAMHPAQDRYLRDAFDPYFDFLLAAGGAMAVLDTSDRIIGTSRFYVAPDPPDSHSIGFTFLERVAWGGTTNYKMKRLMIDHLFTVTDAVWFHIAPDNIRSQRATAKLGATYDGDRTLDLGTGAALMQCHRLDRPRWDAVVQARG